MAVHTELDEPVPSAPRVLLVDDDASFTEALSVVFGLDERVAVVGRAGDGAEAIALTAELQPDLVLMDIHMPVMDGFEAARRLRAAFPAIPVVFLTGISSPAMLERALLAGAAGLLTKETLGRGLIDALLGIVRECNPTAPSRRKFPATTASLRPRALPNRLVPQPSTHREASASPRGGLDPEAASPLPERRQ